MTTRRYYDEKIATYKARELIKLADKYQGQSFQQILHSYASMELTGEQLILLPKSEAKTYSAEEIGEKLGISANLVGGLANQNNLKTDEYGGLFNDKSRNSTKEVQMLRYYEDVIPE